MSMPLEGSVPIQPSEDTDRVIRCVLNIFPGSDTEVLGDRINFTTDDLVRFIEILGEQKIRDTAVMVLDRGLRDDSTRFHLNKQAAFMGKVNFTDGDSNLGDIDVTIIEGAMALIENIRPDLE